MRLDKGLIARPGTEFAVIVIGAPVVPGVESSRQDLGERELELGYPVTREFARRRPATKATVKDKRKRDPITCAGADAQAVMR